MKGGLLLSFLVEVGLISYRDLTGRVQDPASHVIVGLPIPSDYLSAVAVFGALGFLPAGDPSKVGTALGWAIVVATYLNLWPGAPKSKKKGSTTPSFPPSVPAKGPIV
jgi:uncharacterized RDD family membrane protein YckC